MAFNDIPQFNPVISAGTNTLAGNFTLSNSNNVSFGMNTAGVVTASATVAASGAAISAAGASASAGTLVWSNSNNVSFGMAGSTITATVGGPIKFFPGVAAYELSQLSGTAGRLPYATGATADLGGGSTRSSLKFQMYPLAVPADVHYTDVLAGRWLSTVAGTGSQTIEFGLGLYTRNASTYSLLTAWYGGEHHSQNSNTLQTFQSFMGTNSASNTVSFTTGNDGAGSLFREVMITSGTAVSTITAGQYFVAALANSASNGLDIPYFVVGQQQSFAIGWGNAGWAGLGANASSNAAIGAMGVGSFSTTFSNTVTAFATFAGSVNTSAVNNGQNVSGFYQPYIMFRGS